MWPKTCSHCVCRDEKMQGNFECFVDLLILLRLFMATRVSLRGQFGMLWTRHFHDNGRGQTRIMRLFPMQLQAQYAWHECVAVGDILKWGDMDFGTIGKEDKQTLASKPCNCWLLIGGNRFCLCPSSLALILSSTNWMLKLVFWISSTILVWFFVGVEWEGIWERNGQRIACCLD